MTLLDNLLTRSAVAAFGLGMPTLSPSWCSTAANDITADDARLALSVPDSTTWLAPLGGQLRAITGPADLRLTLIAADGNPLTGAGFLLELHQQAFLRLSRLYAQVLEPAGRPGRDAGLPLRPVPRYFFYAVAPAGQAGGTIGATKEVCAGGRLTVYDEHGFPIDPLATASALLAIMAAHAILQQRAVASDPTPAASTQLAAIAGLAGAGERRVRLSFPSGQPRDDANLSGLTAVAGGPSGLFQAGAGPVSLSAVSNSFPASQRRLIWLGPGTSGTLGESFVLPAIPAGVTLARDFFHLRVVQLDTYLLGQPNTGFAPTPVEPRPEVRLHEPVTVLADGNDVLAAGSAALTGTPAEALCVAQEIRGDFPTPTAPGAAAHWPQFPPTNGAAAPVGALRADLRGQIAATAHWLDGGNPAIANVDVVVTLNNLPAEATVRVYPRAFIPDAYDGRGDGAGGIVPASGTLSLRLPDPLGLRRPGLDDASISIPGVATLACDVVVVKRTGEKRIYGNLSAPIDPAAPGDPTPPATNPFGTAARRGVSNAGILGLGHTDLPTGGLHEAIIALTGEGTPRDASRQPTMARRDLLVAGLHGGTWKAVLSGGRLAPEAHSSDQRLGTPGGRGGRETQQTGAATEGGRLAYDIARMAFRRTDHIVARLEALADDRWSPPAELTSGGAGAGSFAGAVLQTVAPRCETPELSLISQVIDPATIPATFDALVDWLNDRLDGVLPPGSPARGRIVNALTNTLGNLNGNNALDEATRQRLATELLREVLAACFGRRDAQWALREAIGQARRFVYVESPGIAATSEEHDPDPRAVDLFAALDERLTRAPGLHVMLCSPREPDFGPGYEPFVVQQVQERFTRIRKLATANDMHARVAAFHPIGFPGRPSALEATVVIVDDLWMLVGSSTFRRRGLTFDGGSDLVLTDSQIVNGRSPTIARFRRSLMAARLGVSALAPGTTGMPADTNFVRLNDGVEAFYVVQELLRAGGLGRIARLWAGLRPGDATAPPTSVSTSLANPEGDDLPLPEALALRTLAGLRAF